MAAKRRKPKSGKVFLRRIWKKYRGLVFTLAVALILYGVSQMLPEDTDSIANIDLPQIAGGESSSQSAPIGDGEFELHMIDVGQGLSIFLRAPDGECALIDAGDRDDGERVSDYLREEGVEELDLLIATHAHADHIGGMAQVAKDFPAEKIIMTYLPADMQPTTKSYTNLLQAIADRGEKITPASPGSRYPLGDALLTVLGPVTEYEDLNNTSVVSRVTYGETAFIVPGDAETDSEADILRSGRELRADVLIAGHHGSSTSSSLDFLREVRPKYLGISCGLDNSYGHPHRETLEKIAELGLTALRTDLQGTVVFYTDGENIRVSTEKE